jgi:CHAD domain-containing protein
MSSAPPGTGPASLLRERVRRVFREFPGALAGEEEPVHQVRVAGRRLRVALPLLAAKPGGRRVRKARRTLRDLTRAAGSGRDLDVLLALFEERLDGLEEVSNEQKELRKRLRAARTRSRGGLAAGILDLDIDGLRRHLRRIRSRGTADPETVLARTRAATEGNGQRVLDGLAAVGDRYDPEALHALRRRIRELRYTAEVDELLRGAEPGASAIWKRLQDAIGVLHDVHVLSGWMGRLAERASARGRLALAEAATKERETFEAEGRRRHRKLLEAGPVELVEKAVMTVVGGDGGGGDTRKGKGESTSSSAASRSAFQAAPPPGPPPGAA